MNEIDALNKKANNRQYTYSQKQWFEEQPSADKSLNIGDLWIEAIPSNPPMQSTPQVEIVSGVILTEDITTQNSMAWLFCETPGNLSSQGGDFICPNNNLSNKYFVRIFDNNGLQIPIDDPSQWVFDYTNGVLVFNATVVNFVAPYKLYGYRYVGQKGSLKAFKSTLGEAYEGLEGDGAGRIINVDSGPVVFNASNSSAPIQINTISYVPTLGVQDGQICLNNGLMYVYDGTRLKWLSMSRETVSFGSKRGDGCFLSQTNNITSAQAGWVAMRSGTIVGITAQGATGYSRKQLDIYKSSATAPVFSFQLNNFVYLNSNMDIPFNAGDLLKVYCRSQFGTTFHLSINLEICWKL
jgi:hypothetical protein